MSIHTTQFYSQVDSLKNRDTWHNVLYAILPLCNFFVFSSLSLEPA